MLDKIKFLYLYVYFLNKKNQNEFVSWFYAQSSVGFLLSLIFMTIIHLFFLGLHIPLVPQLYILLWIMPWLFHVFYFYNFFKRNIIIEPVTKEWKWGFWIILLISKFSYWYTLFLYAANPNII